MQLPAFLNGASCCLTNILTTIRYSPVVLSTTVHVSNITLILPRSMWIGNNFLSFHSHCHSFVHCQSSKVSWYFKITMQSITIQECHVFHHSVWSSITVSTDLLEAHMTETDRLVPDWWCSVTSNNDDQCHARKVQIRNLSVSQCLPGEVTVDSSKNYYT